MPTARHEKILVDGAAVGHDAHADWYRFGAEKGLGIPLVLYFGGAISSAVYHARRSTLPMSSEKTIRVPGRESPSERPQHAE